MNKKSVSNIFFPINFSIIIPNLNGTKFIPNCLNSLIIASKKCHQSQFELIFVDNGSTDKSVEISKKIIKKNPLLSTTYLTLNTNHGFAKAVNIGINKAKYPWVVILNNDLNMESNWFQLIYASILNNKDPKVTTFFGTVLNKDGTRFESQGLDFKIEGKCLNISNKQPFNQSKIIDLKPFKVWGASASLIVYQKDIIQKIGLFDADFFAYEEDVDLSFRLNRFGYKTLYIPQAISYHFGGGTSNCFGNFRNRMDAKNWIFLIIKNYSTNQFWPNFYDIFIERLRNFSGLIKSTISHKKYLSFFFIPFDIFRTYGEVIIKLPKIVQKRYQIKKLLKYNN